ncbi:hypothetical protein LEP3755_00460 [Leptolyngbya sp. NIES-3755]|nr:hypothetical protein LEP3755_00460 [Leptolyngbya sp. NIES-3755]
MCIQSITVLGEFRYGLLKTLRIGFTFRNSPNAYRLDRSLYSARALEVKTGRPF